MRTRLGDLRRVLAEALKKSDADRVAADIERAATGAGARVAMTVDTSSKLLNVFARLRSGDEAAAESAMMSAATKHGWTLLSKNTRRGDVVWWFEPEPHTKGPVSPTVLPASLWHTTMAENVPSILQQGLIPRQRQFTGTSRKYSPRIYLATDERGAKATINRPGDWAFLMIDTAKLPKDLKFYVDQEFGHRKDGMPMAIYTMDAIPPEAISEV